MGEIQPIFKFQFAMHLLYNDNPFYYGSKELDGSFTQNCYLKLNYNHEMFEQVIRDEINKVTIL